jgi:uncharacterized protein YjdB
LLLALLLAACVGTDEVDDPIVGERIEIQSGQLALLIGDTATVQATYFDRYGVERDFQLNWQSSQPSVASVSDFGLVQGLAPGQSQVRASYGNALSGALLVTVVASGDDIAQVLISSPSGNQLNIGQQVALDLVVTNLAGDELSGFGTMWESSNPEVLQIDGQGVVTGLANGVSSVKAIADGIESNPLIITVGTTSRSGTFQGANGYNASGSTTLFINDSGELILTLSSDFSTDFALGTFIYLSNSTSGSGTAAGGFEVQEITSGGAKTFNITSLDASIGIADFQHVIVLCKPASITFGIATLN